MVKDALNIPCLPSVLVSSSLRHLIILLACGFMLKMKPNFMKKYVLLSSVTASIFGFSILRQATKIYMQFRHAYAMDSCYDNFRRQTLSSIALTSTSFSILCAPRNK